MANKVEAIKKEKDGLDVWPDLVRYSKEGFAAITPEDFTRLRWYGIYQQQPNDGHFMLRVKIPGGDISAAQWRVLGEISRDFGRGIADLTTRQNIQFHWLTIETIPAVIEKMNSVGLTTVGACGDITRNVAGCPVAGIDPEEIYDCRPIVSAITRYFLGNKDFSDLPRKYKMTIAGCAHQCHQPEINDVGISAIHIRSRESRVQSRESRVQSPDAPDISRLSTLDSRLRTDVRFLVRVGGGLSTQPKLSQQLNIMVTAEQVPDVCRGITEIFRDYGYRERRNHARLKFLVDDWGPQKFRDVLIERLGWTPEPAIPLIPVPSAAARDHTGIHAQKQHGLSWIGVSVLTGRLSAEQMLAAADIAETYCAGALRTTNQQNLLFPNIAVDDLEDAKRAIRTAGFEWEVSPFRREGVACTGTEFCNLAITETKLRLKEIVAHLELSLLWGEPLRINVNGCPNSCGQHHIGDIGLQGCLARVGDQQVEAYDICLGGRLGADAKFTRAIQRKVPAPQVKFAIENLLRQFKATKSPSENFGNWVDRHTDEQLGESLGLHLLAQDDPSWTPPPPRHAPAGME